MTLFLSCDDFSALMGADSIAPESAIDEEIRLVSAQLGRGYEREIDLSAQMGLSVFDFEFRRDLAIATPVHEHLVQMMILTAGAIDCDIYPIVGEGCGYVSGSGISPAYVDRRQKDQRMAGINVHLEPELLGQLLGEDGWRSSEWREFVQQDDWKLAFFPAVTAAMQCVVQEIVNVPYQGITKRMYLQAKVLELLTLMVDPVLSDRTEPLPDLKLKPETIERLHFARAILTTQLENPPTMLELGQQVGLSDRTLRRGFQALFQTTVIDYLTQQRMIKAEQLLRDRQHTVSEVARMVGYGHLGRFAAAFRRQFGIMPKECLAGCRSHHFKRPE
ncbi:MAG: helix-turn-helix transcriptional regulator [Leptolyngbyaceae cyanobacterium SM1_4_3]|nr:helix-turn-helix transcriptional regulator [Leptolyngbyaceae cyanobacterium SM1_4_3]